jgi:hypothetical protein
LEIVPENNIPRRVFVLNGSEITEAREGTTQERELHFEELC